MNAATFRIVHFVPDPFLGGRVPIAALVQSDGRLTVVRVPHLPGPACLGRESAAAAMRLALEDLERLRSFEHLPASMGPQVVLGEVREVPLHVDDPVGWVARALSGGRDPHAHATQSHDWARGARGMQLMRAHHLERVVDTAVDEELIPFLDHIRATGENALFS